MGMFDYVECEVELPDAFVVEDQRYCFQTKNFENTMDTFRITKEGRLFYLEKIWEYLGEYDPGWTKPKGTKIPKYEVVREEWVEWHTHRGTPFHGEFNFYTSDKNKNWHEYIAIFEHGQLAKIIVDKKSNAYFNKLFNKDG